MKKATLLQSNYSDIWSFFDSAVGTFFVPEDTWTILQQNIDRLLHALRGRVSVGKLACVFGQANCMKQEMDLFAQSYTRHAYVVHNSVLVIVRGLLLPLILLPSSSFGRGLI